jgi:arylsulfatase A-like enzyme
MPEPGPNLLLITSDQQHWNTLGLTNPELSTPNLDRLAARGTLFTRARHQAPRK